MKKTFIAIGISLLGILLYLMTDALGITILLPFLIIIHIICSILFVKKNYKKKCMYVSISIFAIYVLLLIIPFPLCSIVESHPGWKYPQHTQGCDCIGVKKAKMTERVLIYSSQCIGVITNIKITPPQIPENCEANGAEFQGFNDGCLNNCWAERKKLELGVKKMGCGMIPPYQGCACGEGNCWNGHGCESINISEEKCAKEHESAGGSCVGCAQNCCLGLTMMDKKIVNGECIKNPFDPGGGICSNCGNGICETENNENNCTCPEDCEQI